MKDRKFPILKKSGSVVVKVYRIKHATTQDGYAYTISWVGPHGRQTRQFGKFEKAEEEAQLKADQLAKGLADNSNVSRDDIQELAEARRLAGTTPLLSALAEWAKAREIAGAAVLEACTAFSARKGPTVQRIQLSVAIDRFIKAKEAAGKQGERTYRAKLKPLLEGVGDVYLDTITERQLTAYLEKYEDGVTRNDLRKRAGALFRWSRRSGFLPREAPLEIEHTERAKEEKTDIGIIDSITYSRLLAFFREEHPGLLAAVIIAGFCGLRADEIHGKRHDRTKRQVWEDVFMDSRRFLRVTNAKTNTPAWRHVPLVPAAIAWLKLCPGERTGPICGPGDMEKVRALAIAAGFDLPENCFRHSFITFDIALNENKPATALKAGNSVTEIDKRYRRPMTKREGKAWFAVIPNAA